MKKSPLSFSVLSVFSLMLVLPFSCGPSERNVKKQVAEMLQKRYHEEFEIKSVHEQYIVHPSYHLYVYPKKHPNWVFGATLSKERSNDLVDNYPQKKLNYQATEDFENHFKSSKKQFRAGIEPRLAITDSIFADFKNLQKHQTDEDIINIDIASFGEIIDTANPVIFNDIREYIKYYREMGYYNVQIIFRVYNQNIISNLDLSKLTFSFMGKLSESKDSFDTEHVNDKIFSIVVKMNKNSELPTDEELKEKIVILKK